MSNKDLTLQCLNYISKYPNGTGIPSDLFFDIYTIFVDCINFHNELYYQKSEPIISDKQRDELFRYLQTLEKKRPDLVVSHSPTQSFDAQLEVQTEFKKAKHLTEMISLQNSYNAEDLKDWENRMERERDRILKSNPNLEDRPLDFSYIIEPKFDGLGIDLIYRYGKLSQAITRGDGTIGEDVTANVKTLNKKFIPDFISQIKDISKVSFRGEIVISKSQLKKINKEREAEGLTSYSNTRNLASGSLKQLDPNITAKRNLECYIYQKKVEKAENEKKDEDLKKDEESKFFSKLGFQYYSITDKVFTNIDEVIAFCKDLNTKKELERQDVDFDGLVIKVKDEHLREILGDTAHHPRRAIAYKFPAIQESAQILSVDFQIGRTGILTPVANITPTELSGATIKRVSLHNFDFIINKDIQIGDFVWVQRSGEVIPYVVSVIKKRRNNTTPILVPDFCPSCGEKIPACRQAGQTPNKNPESFGKDNSEDIEYTNFYYCTNIDCPAQLKEKLIYFVSRNAMNIEGFGESIIEILIQQKIITKLTDIYKLLDFQVQATIKRFPGINSKKVYNFVQNLEKTKQTELWRIIVSLGINGIGSKMAKIIAKEIQTKKQEGKKGDKRKQTVGTEFLPSKKTSKKDFFSMMELHYQLSQRDFLENIYGMGEKTVEECIRFCKNNKNIFEELEGYGIVAMKTGLHSKNNYNLNIQEKTNNDGKDRSSTMVICITGSFPVPRDSIIDIFEKNGFEFTNSISKKLGVLLVGENGGSKLRKAESLGIEVLSGWANIVSRYKFLEDLKVDEDDSRTMQEVGLFA